MRYTLSLEYRWMVVTEDGILKPPRDEWGDPHLLSKHFPSRESAIEEYARFVNDGMRCPNSMVLVEQHTKGINWDE